MSKKKSEDDGGQILLKEENITGSTMHISPPEVLIQIKNNNIAYCLSLLVLSIGLLQILNIVWK